MSLNAKPSTARQTEASKISETQLFPRSFVVMIGALAALAAGRQSNWHEGGRGMGRRQPNPPASPARGLMPRSHTNSLCVSSYTNEVCESEGGAGEKRG